MFSDGEAHHWTIPNDKNPNFPTNFVNVASAPKVDVKEWFLDARQT